MQTLRAGCSKAEQKISPRRSPPPPPQAESALAVVRLMQKFRPTTDPVPGGAGRPKFNQLEMVTTFIYKPSLVNIDACNFELSW